MSSTAVVAEPDKRTQTAFGNGASWVMGQRVSVSDSVLDLADPSSISLRGICVLQSSVIGLGRVGLPGLSLQVGSGH